jgi:uncharacterized protein (DUF1330 family)
MLSKGAALHEGDLMLYLTVKLYGRKGIRGEFKDYEAKALAIFRKHGGEVMVAYAPVPDPAQAEWPDEIHVLRIAGPAEFEAFMKDPERIGLAAERESVIRKTEVLLSQELIEY